ncbi:LSM domain-containing protein [Methanobacterium sp.]|jgi:small nuclear ribonucleoprotein (snRNP)-like protein|uniref:LSM domain-containing protein n=1 Tax=Methanobacterium sp. TaxID=2164 RepID=UPI003158A9A8
MRGKIIAAKSEERKENPLHRQLKQFQNKDVNILQKDNETKEGKLLAIDNYLNVAIETSVGLEFIKGTKILYIQLLN